MERELLKLLEEYHHFKFMTSGIGIFGNPYRMDLHEFMRWLKSRQD